MARSLRGEHTRALVLAPESNLRLSRTFGTSPGFRLSLQLDYELMRAERENGERIQREVQPPMRREMPGNVEM